MTDPAIKELMDKLWWLWPGGIFIGLFVLFLERKIDDFKRKRRIKK